MLRAHNQKACRNRELAPSRGWLRSHPLLQHKPSAAVVVAAAATAAPPSRGAATEGRRGLQVVAGAGVGNGWPCTRRRGRESKGGGKRQRHRLNSRTPSL